MFSDNEQPLQLGDRVAAVADVRNKVVELYGYGIYIDQWLDTKDGTVKGRLVLDDNTVLLEDQCHYIREDIFKDTVTEKGMTVTFVEFDSEEDE